VEKRGSSHYAEPQIASKFLQYRKEAKPVLHKTTGLHLVNGEIKIKVGINNRCDHESSTLDEQLGKGSDASQK